MASEPKIMEFKDLKLELTEEEELVRLSWFGASTDKNPAVFLTDILKETFGAADSGKKNLILDFRKLDYMNSSTIAPLAKILADPDKNIPSIVIYYDKNSRWQDISFSALRMFSDKDSRIEITGT